MTKKNKETEENIVDNSTVNECQKEAEKSDVNEDNSAGSSTENTTENNTNDNSNESEESNEENSQEELLKKLADKQKESQEYLEMLRRTMADFDNFRKRANKEKETIYGDGFADAVKTFLPVLDNLERAVNASGVNDGNLYEGLKMVVKIFCDSLEKSGVIEIKAEGEKFNPDYHNAVMHIEDEAYEENSIVEVLQKGYMYKDKIIRHSMVKVAN